MFLPAQHELLCFADLATANSSTFDRPDFPKTKRKAERHGQGTNWLFSRGIRNAHSTSAAGRYIELPWDAARLRVPHSGTADRLDGLHIFWG